MAVVVMTSVARQQAESLPVPIFVRVSKLVERLRRWPEVSGARPLTGRLAGRFRLRTGDYRLQFHVEGEKVIVEKIGHRDRFYED
ncbi:MAG: type II toxin-antitoxin system RelE/ParE family toxin [Planctomycetes bacterium]|nr:type II toxin-antitoxin system RelE/ParE family toxin [Planctomycetota bacterium]MBU4399505.1 type II toxin-antitoxin system RelE/ParE family toxin [Planctomycetota bacterium]